MRVGEDLRHLTVLGHEVRTSVRRGTGDGPVLLMCNGIGASLELLQPFVDELDGASKWCGSTCPASGGSPDPRTPYNFALLALFTDRLMTRLGYDWYDVLGISWGGGLAQQIAFQSPRRCRRLVLVSTATGSVMIPARPHVLRKMLTPRRYLDPEYAVSVAPELYGDRMRDRPGDVRHLMHGQTRARVGGTCSSCSRVWAGPACSPCRSSGSRR